MTNVVSVMFVNVKALTLFFFSFSFSFITSFYLTNQQLLSFFLLLHRLYGSSFCLLFWDLLPLSCKCRWCYSTHTHTHTSWFQRNGRAKKSHMSGVFTTVSLLLQDCEISSKNELLLLFFVYLFIYF